jgi:hypothetical protein
MVGASLTRCEQIYRPAFIRTAIIAITLVGFRVLVDACGQAQATASTKSSVSLVELLPDRLAVRIFVNTTPCPGLYHV